MDNANHGHVPGADLIRHAESDTEYSTPDARMQDKVGVDRRTAVVPRAAAGGNSPAVDHAHAGVFVVDPHLADGGFEVRPEQLAGVTRAVRTARYAHEAYRLLSEQPLQSRSRPATRKHAMHDLPPMSATPASLPLPAPVPQPPAHQSMPVPPVALPAVPPAAAPAYWLPGQQLPPDQTMGLLNHMGARFEAIMQQQQAQISQMGQTLAAIANQKQAADVEEEEEEALPPPRRRLPPARPRLEVQEEEDEKWHGPLPIPKPASPSRIKAKIAAEAEPEAGVKHGRPQVLFRLGAAGSASAYYDQVLIEDNCVVLVSDRERETEQYLPPDRGADHIEISVPSMRFRGRVGSCGLNFTFGRYDMVLLIRVLAPAAESAPVPSFLDEEPLS